MSASLTPDARGRDAATIPDGTYHVDHHLTDGRDSVLDATASRMPAALYDIL